MTKDKKIAIIIAFRDFQDIEYFIPKEIFEANNIITKTVSTKEGIAIGVYGGDAQIDILLKDLSVNDFDAIVFIGGGGCLKYLDNEESYGIARETVDSGKLLASICISPVVLAKAGVLQGKKATVWTSPQEKKPIAILKENGASYMEENVIIDGKIITALGPQAANEFGKEVVKMLLR